MQQSKNEENHSANPIGIGRDAVWDKGIPLYGIAKGWFGMSKKILNRIMAEVQKDDYCRLFRVAGRYSMRIGHRRLVY